MSNIANKFFYFLGMDSKKYVVLPKHLNQSFIAGTSLYNYKKETNSVMFYLANLKDTSDSILVFNKFSQKIHFPF